MELAAILKESKNDHHMTTMRHGPPWVCPQMQVLRSSLSRTLQTGPNPALPRSPPKRVVKAKLAEELEKNELLSRDSDVAMRAVQAKTRQISTLKQQVCALSDALQSERKKSRATVAKLLGDAEGVMARAFGIQADDVCRRTETALTAAKDEECFE